MVSERYRSYAAVVVMDSGVGGATLTEDATAAPPINQTAANRSYSYQTEEFDDPLYLHITENPNLMLVSPPLTESNYASWSRSMKIALEVKNKFDFVDGSIVCLGEADPRYAIWKRCNDIVCSWILKSLSPTIAESVLYFEVAEEIWTALRKRYSQADPHRIAEVQNAIYKNVRGTLSINEYFTKCNVLWEQLNAMRPMYMCECVPKCSCKLMSKIQKDREEDQVIRFLEGLNEEFETIKSGVLVMDPIPNIEKVLNMALKLERKLNGSGSHKKMKLLIPMQLNIRILMNNHRWLPQLPWLPPGWVAGYKSKSRQNNDNQQTQNGSVNQVGDIGLSANQFQRLLSLLQNQNQGSQASTSAALTVGKSGTRTDFRDKPEESKEGRSISNYLVNSILNCSTVWILDSGATDHITCSLEYLDNCHKVQNISVKLPNGETVEVANVGEIKLYPNLLLKNVLHIPTFSFNIISASRLAKQSSCKLIMNDVSCNIQDPCGIVHGFAEEKGGLYLIKHPPAKKEDDQSDIIDDRQCSAVTLQLWHNRLGHYPMDKIQYLYRIKSAQSNKIHGIACDSCHFAKHKRSLFSFEHI
ncbi:PREDICTED: uncharacterized protein LOC109152757 [Ipomoea nil]|uniref:uncharacterized protein LOC109152757 n=1 Tax=Ipomoea nil TaxID=35883 RepID=UPI000901E290|nr:PREDICTED: uncharacterized protein LOC109152757 [Ipomoea nil]